MAITLGPVLALQECTNTTWMASVLVAYRGGEQPPSLHYRRSQDRPPERSEPEVSDRIENLAQGTRTVARYLIEVPLEDRGQAVTYWIEGIETEQWKFHVPPRDWSQLRFGYASCNGFSHTKTERDTADKYNRWTHLLDHHKSRPLHVLLLGGDQVYGDPIWERALHIRQWAEIDSDRKWKARFTRRHARDVTRFYGRLYEDRWSREPLRRVLAQIPSLMMWDDHDIFDGWGSHPIEHTESPMYQGIFKEASRFFRVFQLQNLGDDPGRHAICPEYNCSYAMKIGSIAVLALDLRTERTPERIISLEAWDKIYAWLDNNLDGQTHLLVMASVPVVHLDFGALEKALALVPGKQDLEDDFRDHWLSRPHKKERLRLIHRLFRYAREKKTRVTILSGDIHVAGMGVIEDRREPELSNEQSTITQLISSPVVHPTPPQMLLYGYDALNFFEGEQEEDQGLYSRMMKLPTSSHRFIARRNWMELEIEPGDAGRIWASWYAEEEPESYTAVLHAVAA